MTPLVDVFQYRSVLAIDTRPSRPWKLGPWAFASQGHFLVAVQDDTIATEPTPENRLQARRYLDGVPPNARPVSLSALRIFVGPVDSPVACDDCDGTGYQIAADTFVCEHCGHATRLPCEECDGDGLAEVPIRLGWIADVPVNLGLLAYALTCVPADADCQIASVESVTKSSGNGLALLVIGRAWRIAVMSVRDPVGKVPVFPSVVPAATCELSTLAAAGSPPPSSPDSSMRVKASSGDVE